jgi:formylglycine-generating enzyme required for sulfatase activity
MKKPEDRYQTSREMAVDFFLAIGMNAEAETILNASPLTLEPARVSKKTSQPRSSNWTLPVAGIGIACLILLAVGAFMFRPYMARDVTVTNTAVAQPSPDVPNSPVPTESPLDLLPDSTNMIQIPAGSYIVGREPADDFHSAVQTIQLQPFWIDEFQVTDAQYQEFMDQTGALSPMITSVPENYPVRGVTWDQANSYCVWKLKRLPAEAEWEAAGRGGGPNPQLYPWGEDASLGNKLPDTDTYEIGTNSFNISPFGVYDLVGNVWEWVEDPYAFVQDGYYVLRGGRYSLPQDLAYRLVVAPDSDYITYAGFRCAADQVK